MTPSHANRPARLLAAGLTSLISLTCLIYFLPHVPMALDRRETGLCETPLVYTIMRQLTAGASGLYGPFGASNPWVLIHGPLYYRLAAACAAPFTFFGVGATGAALIAGRGLSFLAFLACLYVIARLATLDGGTRRAGMLAALLVAGSPIAAILTVMVRPDTLALWLQTLGIFLVARELTRERVRGLPLLPAYAAFALACAAKQHDIVSMGMCSLCLGHAWLRGRIRLRPVVLAHGVWLGVLLVYLTGEDLVTRGMMSHAAFILPAGPFRAINFGGSAKLAEVTLMLTRKSAGLLAIGVACFVASRAARRLPALDRYLSLLCAAELASLVPLCRGNSGAWDNYALQAVVLGCVLVARALDRLLADPPRLRVLALPACAALLYCVDDTRQISLFLHVRAAGFAEVDALLRDPAVSSCPRAERYFAGEWSQPLNRLYGRPDLSHDEWLYSAFEKVGCAEPRERWLRSALEAGPLRQVVQCARGARVEGVSASLTELGFRAAARHGRYVVWNRTARAQPSLAAAASSTVREGEQARHY